MELHILNGTAYLKGMQFFDIIKRSNDKEGILLEIRVLQYFLAVAREESITRAAETLKMTQPPLSRQLKDLEDEVGKKLLIRGSKKVTLTEDGMLLRKRAEEMIDLLEKTKAELASSDENINGKIYIGGGETDAVSFLAQTAEKLQKKYPLIHYQIYSGDAEIVMEKLDKGLIDFGLLVGPVDIGKYITSANKGRKDMGAGKRQKHGRTCVEAYA